MKAKNSPEISLRYFLVILLVPASSIYIMHNIFIIAAVYDEFSKFSAFASLMLLFVNYVVFEIYDWMSRDAVVREQNRLYVQQLELCSRQAEERESLPLSSKLKDNPVHVIVEPSEIRGHALSNRSDFMPEDIQTLNKGCVRFKSGYIPGESEIREAMDRAMIMQLNLLPVARKMVLEELEMKQNG